MKKKTVLLILLMFLLSGCTSLNNLETSDVLDLVLENKNNKYNVVLDGYKYYIPKGIKFLDKEEYNATLVDDKNNTYYFYSDVIRYYNNEKLDYEENKDAYYSKKLDYNKKEGYLEITKLSKDDQYFIEFMYNYGKIEAIVDYDDINDVLVPMGIILSSLNYNRNVLETLIGNKVINYKEETYNVMKPNGNNASIESYLDYEEKYGTYEGYNPSDKDEDEIEIEEIE